MAYFSNENTALASGDSYTNDAAMHCRARWNQEAHHVKDFTFKSSVHPLH